MRPTLIDFVGAVLDAPISRLRTKAVALVICVAGAIGAIYYALAAAVLALEPLVGAVYARLIVAAAFAVIAGLAIVIPRLIASRDESIVERAHAQVKAMPKNDRMAMIIEALLLGFNASTSRKPASKS